MLEGVEGAWLVPVGDVDALTAAITEALENGEDGHVGRERAVEVQNARAMTAHYERLVDELVPVSRA
jgi:glycosyltransferase involved in cell wall biosynthesis